jgi:tetratricopeptide (TPR) repeat protein
MSSQASDRRDAALAHGARLLRQDPRAAAAQAREVLRVDPASADAYRLLGRALRALGEDAAAEAAELDAIGASVHDPALMKAAQALVGNDLPVAERILRPRLKEKPTDVAAIRMMAELAARIGRFADSENLLRRALELAPGFTAARANLATVLYRQNRPADAIAVLDQLLGGDPDNASAQNLKAAALGRIGGYEEALGLYEAVLERFPDQPKVWMSYGHVLKTVGRRDDSIAAYRRAIGLAPTLGEVWWSLANLKTVRLDEQDIAAMTGALEREGIADEDRFHLHFALGKALEDARHYEASFGHYAEGNRLRREMIDYDPSDVSDAVHRAQALFTPDFFAARPDHGCPSPDPIFILGMPRAGSTLIEQILSSHPLVEGTMELPDIPAMVKRLSGRSFKGETGRYPECLVDLSAEECAAFGEEYLDRTRVQRKTDRPFFIDKMPNNWMHVGFIRLILPRAKIVDARRHPLDCCFSNFKQHFARGQGFSYDQSELGRYYADYVRMMRHFDALLPNHVHRVIYERMIEGPEAEVRRLLDHLGLPFDPACLRFYENERAVRTASSEQVRRPINREGLGQWKPYEPWLDPLKEALGPVRDNYVT